MWHNLKNDIWFLSKVKDGTLTVSKEGTVFNNITKRFIGATGSGGYPKISMMVRKDFETGKNIIAHMQIHRLVWLVHKGAIPQYIEVNHIDTNKQNPALDNLELLTHTENWQEAYDCNLIIPRKGDKLHNTKIPEADVIRMREHVRQEKKAPINKWAFEFKCHRITIMSALRGTTYGYLPGAMPKLKVKIKRIKTTPSATTT